jgi:hypothetical protein
MFTDATIVKHGTFLYSHTVVCDLCIQKTNCRYGSGDEEDAPEWRDDVEGEFYYVWYSPAGSRGEFKTGGGVFPTLADAVRHIEESLEGVKWGS